MGSLTGPGLGKFTCSDLATCSLSDLGTVDHGDLSGLGDDDHSLYLPTTGVRSMAGTFSMGTHEIDHLKKVMFREEHDVALHTEGTYLLSLTNKSESVWGNQGLGWLYVHGGVDMNGHPLTEVAAPTQGSHAANKTWVDAHNWGAGDITSGTFAEAQIPNLPTTKITEGTFGVARIPVLPTDRYGSAVLVSGTRFMEGTFNTGNHPIDDVSKIGFRDIHDVALITEGTYSISVVNKAESLWGIIETGHLYTHAGFAWYIEDKVAGEILYAGGLVNLRTADGKWWRTDADFEAGAKGLLGIPMANIVVGDTGKVCIFGRVTNTGWSWTVGATLYVACPVGTITETAPSGSGDQVRKIGHALSSTIIIFNPDATILEIT